MIGDDNGLNYFGTMLANLKTPVVYYGINANPRDYFKKFPPNITGVLERMMVGPLIRELTKILPQAQRVVFMYDASPTAEALISVTFKDRKSIRVGHLTGAFKNIGGWTKWKEAIINLKKEGYDAVVLGLFHAIKDDQGNPIVNAARSHAHPYDRHG